MWCVRVIAVWTHHRWNQLWSHPLAKLFLLVAYPPFGLTDSTVPTDAIYYYFHYFFILENITIFSFARIVTSTLHPKTIFNIIICPSGSRNSQKSWVREGLSCGGENLEMNGRLLLLLPTLLRKIVSGMEMQNWLFIYILLPPWLEA